MPFKLSFILLFGFASLGFSQTILEADGPGNTYELINSVLAPGFDVCETPDCAHPSFGRHITEVWDSELNQYVFEFHIHVNEDNDRCIIFDRQRNEIKTYDKSPANLIGTEGETVVYKWKFKLPEGFQVSQNFTHLHQIKAVGGDEGNPIFCLTARKGNPSKMELAYYESGSLERLKTANLSLFINQWVEVTERIKIDKVNGSYAIEIKNIATGTTILSYSNTNIMTIRSDNRFIRPKWGIYRSLLNSQDLRDEVLRYAYFYIKEEDQTNMINPSQNQLDFQISSSSNYNHYLLQYSLAELCNLDLYVTDILGRKVQTLMKSSFHEAGTHTEEFNLDALPMGVYIVTLKAKDKQLSKKIIKHQ